MPNPIVNVFFTTANAYKTQPAFKAHVEGILRTWALSKFGNSKWPVLNVYSSTAHRGSTPARYRAGLADPRNHCQVRVKNHLGAVISGKRAHHDPGFEGQDYVP
ncbi:hypothetical protein PUNSTDRAFT_139595 [Punctularia strigosozonata HHB-11173 SS5]|uniref:Uncharacterized protein n=1 Tax=Punctularia strigosozonata (strain HHB-11173) TaxID=741275 RepID=R7RZH3_PUNST|nr:uncharacterized protein PUNSTDRAFT_139595 [Punctularia strigosozonata HHB-11173 SS5]EIN03388.1 hypothetical protein PUNSTDRAFT_139595 [Punctularia strigosozonata HHB-11173 SS5]